MDNVSIAFDKKEKKYRGFYINAKTNRKSGTPRFNSKNELEKYLIKIDMKGAIKHKYKKTNKTIAPIVETYKKQLYNEVRETSYETIVNQLNRYVLKPYGNVSADYFCDNIENFKAEILSHKFSPTTTKHIFHYTVQMLDSGIDYDQISADQVHRVRTKLKKFKDENNVSTKEKIVLTTDESKRFLTTMLNDNDGKKWFPFFAIAVTLSPRIGELRALQCKNFDFDNLTITINQQAVTYGGKYHLTPPKSANSIRVLQMSKFLSGVMQEHFKTWKIKNPDDFVFFNKGKPVGVTTINRFLQQFRKKYGFGNITIHTFRRSLETTAFRRNDMSEIDKNAVYNSLGHTKSVGETYYQKIITNGNRTIADYYDNLLGDLTNEKK